MCGLAAGVWTRRDINKALASPKGLGEQGLQPYTEVTTVTVKLEGSAHFSDQLPFSLECGRLGQIEDAFEAVALRRMQQPKP
jgi:hypothetical protein